MRYEFSSTCEGGVMEIDEEDEEEYEITYEFSNTCEGGVVEVKTKI